MKAAGDSQPLTFLWRISGLGSIRDPQRLGTTLVWNLLTVVVSPLQLIDITGKNQDECVIALHDCNGDVNRAINVLLEGNPDTVGLGSVNVVSPSSV